MTIDAAVATAACLTVLEPTSNGLGSDAFALVWIEKEQKLYGLNASGLSPIGVSLEEFRSKYGNEVPKRGWAPVTVPGAPGAWAALNEKYGRLSMAEELAPAIGYAQNGYPVSPVISRLWEKSYQEFSKTFQDACFDNWLSLIHI